MRSQVEDALFEWLAGMGVGLIPLVAHTVVAFGMAPSTKIEGSWAVDWAFLTIATSATSILSVINRYRKGTPGVLRGRAAPALVAITTLFLVSASVLYAVVVGGLSGGSAVSLAVGLFIGSAFVSLYFELTLAARVAQSGEVAYA
jgi:hypothetical protein